MISNPNVLPISFYVTFIRFPVGKSGSDSFLFSHYSVRFAVTMLTAWVQAQIYILRHIVCVLLFLLSNSS